MRWPAILFPSSLSLHEQCSPEVIRWRKVGWHTHLYWRGWSAVAQSWVSESKQDSGGVCIWGQALMACWCPGRVRMVSTWAVAQNGESEPRLGKKGTHTGGVAWQKEAET